MPERNVEVRIVLHKGTSWNSVSHNVRRLVGEWEQAGRVGTRRPATRKEAIGHAISLSLKKIGGRGQERP
jgi:hypothetical protein